jgi:hypothetical protein
VEESLRESTQRKSRCIQSKVKARRAAKRNKTKKDPAAMWIASAYRELGGGEEFLVIDDL